MAKGSLKKRSDGVWSFRVDLPSKPDGSRNQKEYTIYADDELDAEEQRLQILREIQLRTPGTVEPTLEEFMDNWIKTYVDEELKSSTQEQYRWARGHIMPAIGHLKLDEITPYHIKLLKDSKAKDLSNNSRRIMLAVLRKSLNDALDWELIDSNPCRKVKPPAVQTGKDGIPEHMDSEDVPVFLEAAKGYRYRPLFFTKIYTGLRLGELLGMKWSDIKDGKINVQHNLNKKFKIEEVKTAKSKRTVPLSSDTHSVLEAWRRKQAAEKLRADYDYNPWNLVFTSSNGNFVRPRNVRRQMDKIIKRAGIPRITPHGLRHTHATLLFQAGVHPKIVQERLGHSSINVTLDTYSAFIPSMQEDLAANLDSIIGTVTGKKTTNKRSK